MRVNYNHWLRWDFGGRNLYRAVNMNVHSVYKNFWYLATGISYENLDRTSNWLRGGPTYQRSSGMAQWFSMNTDIRKPIVLHANASYGFGFDYLVRGQDLGLELEIHPSDAINFSLGPNLGNFERIDQYVTTRKWEGNTRYILAYVNQRTLSFTARINYNITPDLTVQYYGQPFISRGKYSSFNYVLDPLTSEKEEGLRWYTDQEINLIDNTYFIDENGDANPDYSFGNPNFNFVQFRSNLVVRWEYVPGSEIYLVWTQGNTSFSTPDDRSLFNSLSEDFLSDDVRNSFLVKLTYRFLRK
jgi:hypothetical protein